MYQQLVHKFKKLLLKLQVQTFKTFVLCFNFSPERKVHAAAVLWENKSVYWENNLSYKTVIVLKTLADRGTCLY